MHKIQSGTYFGQPGETVSANTTVHGGGQVSVFVGGQPLVGNQFQLPATAGATLRMQVALVGPHGASCVVAIAVVDGGSDADFLMCSVFNPAPVVFYDFSVAAAAAVATFGSAKNPGPAGVAGGAPARRPKAPAKRRRPATGGR